MMDLVFSLFTSPCLFALLSKRFQLYYPVLPSIECFLSLCPGVCIVLRDLLCLLSSLFLAAVSYLPEDVNLLNK